MMRRFLPLVVSGAVLVAAGLGAGTLALAMSGRPSPDAALTDRDRCFDPRFLRGFQTTRDDKLIITSDNNQAYELTLGGACFGIDSTYMIGIRSRFAMSEICGPFDADILYSDLGPRRAQSCPIVGMRHLQGADAAPYIGARPAKRQTSSSADGPQKPETEKPGS
jgi:hypothetical protein